MPAKTLLSCWFNSSTWISRVFSFLMFLGFNYVSCVLTISFLGHPLWCLLIFTVSFIAVTLFYMTVYCNMDWTKHSGDTADLVNQLRIMDAKKMPFVIERFLQLDKIVTGVATEDDSVISSWTSARDSKDLCVVCMDDGAVIETLPCKHRVMCGQCAWNVFKTALDKNTVHACVICRQEVRDFNGSLFKNLVNVRREHIKGILDETKAL